MVKNPVFFALTPILGVVVLVYYVSAWEWTVATLGLETQNDAFPALALFFFQRSNEIDLELVLHPLSNQ